MMFSRDNNIFLLRRKIVAILLIFSAFFNISLADTDTPEGGAVARFFEYPLRDTTSFNELPFILRDFRKNKYLGEVTGIKNISWDSGVSNTMPPYGFDGAPITNFVMYVTAYYLAPQSGYYNISLKADDYAAVFVGNDGSVMHYYEFTSNELIVTNHDSTEIGLEPTFGSAYMHAGYYWPIGIVYINYMGEGVLDFEIILPDGTVDTQFGERLYAMPESAYSSDSGVPVGFSTIYETFTRSIVPDLATPTTVSTSVYTDWIQAHSADVYIFNYVDVPVSTTAPTTTTTADVSVPITSTYTTAISGNFGSSAPEVFFNFDLEVEVKY